jgi:ribulose-phosphate 3-epimerase
MKKMIAPSILSADFAKLGEEIQMVTSAGADWIHVDVMDGHFVPNLTIGMGVVKAIKPISKIPLDVHLMIEKPEKYIREFISSGSQYLTLHVESTENMTENLKLIRELGCKAGITLRPKTSIEDIKPFLSLVDLVLVMTVEPGFGGQSFMHDQVEKIRQLNSFRKQGLGNFLIEVDGGVDAKTAAICWDAGADVLVAGSAVFKGEKTIENYKKNIEVLK